MGMFDDDALPTALASLHGHGSECCESCRSVFTVEVTVETHMVTAAKPVFYVPAMVP